jgi:glycosyltransferase involved in cell wall biosynthesis
MNLVIRKFENYIIPAFLYCCNLIAYFFTIKKNDACFLLADFDTYGGTRTYFEQFCHFLKGKNKTVICIICEKQKDVAFLNLMNEVRFEYEVIPDKEYVIDYSGIWSLKMYSYYLSRLLSDLNLFISYCRKYKTGSFFISSGEPEKWLYLLWLPVNKMFYILHTLPYRNIGSIGKQTLHKRLSKNKMLLTVSEFAKESILFHWKIDQKKKQYIECVPNFFEKKIKDETVEKEGNVIRILTLGHVVPYKNPLVWIDVAEVVLANAPLKNIEFVWAGDGPMLAECRRKVEHNPSIKFIGFVDHVDQLYLLADIYFQPSLLESQGMSVIGAMCFGLPSVVSDAGGLPESVKDGKNGYVVKADDTLAFAKKLVQLIDDLQRRKEMGRRGKEIFDEKFNKIFWMKDMNRFV